MENMSRIPFTLEAWLKDKNQRVETRDGRIVHDIWPVKNKTTIKAYRTEVCALIDGEQDALVFFAGGKYLPVNAKSPFDLFIVTPEEEMTEFEKELESFYNHHLQVCTYDNQGTVEDSLHDGATKLLALAIDARAKELYKGLKQSKLDKDSIPYHLIEFMCNLYTCRNWKEIEDTAEAYTTRLKAAAMKDLPRWRYAKDQTELDKIKDIALVRYYNNYVSIINERPTLPLTFYLTHSDLAKLPTEKRR